MKKPDDAKKTSVLIADDHTIIRAGLAALLGTEKDLIVVGQAKNGEEAVRETVRLRPDVVIMDLMMPKMDGWQVCREIRQYSKVPIIMLTARSDERDELLGFELGVDEYISKPFSVNEVLARVKAVLRRAGSAGSDEGRICFGGLVIDTVSETAELDGEQLSLSRKEFDLLALLARHPDTYFSRAALISDLWKDAPYVLDRTVDVHIRRLREKLEDDPAAPVYLKTVYGIGYIWAVTG